MQPDLILNEDQRKERFSLSLGRKKIKTEHLALSTSNPTATASSLLNSAIPRTTIYRIVSEGSQTTEKSSKQESLMTIEHQEMKNYKDCIIPNTRVCVIIRRPPTNKSVTVQYNENSIRDTIADNNDEQLTTSGTAESSIEYVPNLDMSKEHQMLDMISPQNNDPIPLETSIYETMDTNMIIET